MNFSDYKKPFPVGVRLPQISIDNSYYKLLGIPSNTNNYDFLRNLCFFGVQQKSIDKLPNKDVYFDRVKEELSVLKDLSFVDYILLNWDVFEFCKKNKIPTGVGRGSAAGSLVNYLVGITKVDPIKYDLFFERFVSKSRAKIIVEDGVTYLDGSLLCDIDNDIAYDRRQEVVDYINQKYKGKTCRILTANTLSSKLCVKECFKLVDNLTETEVNEISNMIPKNFGIPAKLQEAYETEDNFREVCEEHPEAFAIAKKLEGLNKNFGVHPSGIAISYDNITDIMPLQKTKDGETVSCYDMDDVAALAVKFDILGLRTLSVIQSVETALGINSEDVDIDSSFIYSGLDQIRNTAGLFQIEASTNSKVCREISPKNLEQLAAVVAIARPGALDFLDDYSRFIRSGESQLVHEYFSDVLNYTGGIPLYQEQLMKMAVKIGFSLDEAEQLRRIVGKKKVDEIPKWKQMIIDKISERNLDPEIGDVLWKVAEDSSNYSFNKSHAVSYAITAAQTAYLKFKYPQEFFLALLSMAEFEPKPFDEINRISQELRHFNIKLLPPDLGRSKKTFSIEGKNIRYGLKSIKGVKDKVIDSLVEFRGEELKNKYEMFLLAKQSGLNIGVLSSLIQAGMLDSYASSRSRLVLEAQTFNLLTDREKNLIIPMGERYNFDILNCLYDLVSKETKDDKNRVIVSKKRFGTIRKKYDQYKKIYELNTQHEKLANWHFERKTLGYSFSYKLKDVFQSSGDIIDSKNLLDTINNRRVKISGWVTDKVRRTSASGNKYLRVTLNDEMGEMNVMCFERSFDLDDLTPSIKDDSIILVSGRKSDDIIFADSVKVYDEKIYMKLSEIK